MSPPAPAKAAKADRLSKQRIVEVAVALANEHGLAALSMRKLATELGTGAMSLYNHVANKDELLTAMIDVVFAQMHLPDEAAETDDATQWRAAMRASAISARDVYTRYPWAVGAALNASPGPERLRHAEAVLTAFANSGLEPDPAHHAYHAYEVHISGFMLSQLAFGYDAEQPKDAAPGFLAELDAEVYPYMAAHVAEHLEDRGSDFEFGLDLLLDGFERLRISNAPN